VVARVDPDEVPYRAAEVADGESVVPAAGAPTVDAVLAARPFAALIASAAATHAWMPGWSTRSSKPNPITSARSLTEGRQGADATDAGHGPAVRRVRSLRPRTNIEAGVRHLKDLLSRFDLGMALAAYNAGEGTVRRYGGVPPFAETRNYVAGILQRVGR